MLQEVRYLSCLLPEQTILKIQKFVCFYFQSTCLYKFRGGVNSQTLLISFSYLLR